MVSYLSSRVVDPMRPAIHGAMAALTRFGRFEATRESGWRAKADRPRIHAEPLTVAGACRQGATTFGA